MMLQQPFEPFYTYTNLLTSVQSLAWKTRKGERRGQTKKKERMCNKKGKTGKEKNLKSELRKQHNEKEGCWKKKTWKVVALKSDVIIPMVVNAWNFKRVCNSLWYLRKQS